MKIHMGQWDPRGQLPDAFLDLPERVYEHDPFWLGEDRHQIMSLFNEQNSWFEQGQAWIGSIDGLARLAGFFAPQQMIQACPVAYFGFWEGMDDIVAHTTLFAGFRDWARAKGAKEVYGPINFTTFQPYRLRLDRFDEGAFPGEPWNPEYAPGLLESLGFRCCHTYVSTFAELEQIREKALLEQKKLWPALQGHIVLKAMTAQYWLDHLQELYGFVEQVFSGNFAYTPINLDTFKKVCGEAFAQRFCPRTSILAEDSNGDIAGFFLTYPDYAPLLRRPVAMPWSEVGYKDFDRLPFPRIQLARTAGVRPDFRSLGLFTVMSAELLQRAKGLYDQSAGVLIRQDNTSYRFADRHGQRRHHYGLFKSTL